MNILVHVSSCKSFSKTVVLQGAVLPLGHFGIHKGIFGYCDFGDTTGFTEQGWDARCSAVHGQPLTVKNCLTACAVFECPTGYSFII